MRATGARFKKGLYFPYLRLVAFAVTCAICAQASASSCKIVPVFEVALVQPIPPSRTSTPDPVAPRPGNRFRSLLPSGADPETVLNTSSGWKPTANLADPAKDKQRQLFHLIYRGDVGALRRLIASGAVDVNGYSADDEERPIEAASHHGRLEIVKLLVEAGAKVREDRRTGKDRRLAPVDFAARSLYEAAVEPQPNFVAPSSPKSRQKQIEERVGLIDYLLAKGADAGASSSTNSFPLVYVMEAPPFDGQIELMKRLLQHGAEAGDLGRVKHSPLRSAAVGNNVAVVDYVLSFWRPSQEALHGALFAAVEYSTPEMVRRLLSAGANPRLPEGDYKRTLFSVAMRRRPLDLPMIELVGREGADVDEARLGLPLGNTALAMATVLNDHALMELLLRLGANPNLPLPDSQGYILQLAMKRADPESPATRAKRLETVRILLANRADPNLKSHGLTTLMWTLPEDHAVIDLLLAHGATISFDDETVESYKRSGQDRMGYPIGQDVGPITWALFHGNEHLAGRLIESGPPSSADCGAIYHAAALGQVNALRLLLKRTPNWESIRDYEEQTPIFAAAESGKLDAVRVLHETRRQDINWQTPVRFVRVPPGGGHGTIFAFPKAERVGGVSVLMAAAKGGNPDVVAFLIANGAKPKLEDVKGNTAFSYVRQSGNEALNQALVPKAGAN